MHVRLIASDLDGTLLGPNERLQRRTLKLLRHADHLGVQVVAATGRSGRTLPRVLKGADMIRWAICSNGATRLDRSTGEKVHTCLPPDAVLPTLAAIRTQLPDIALGWETPDGFVYDHAWVAYRSHLGDVVPAFPADPPPIIKLMVAHPQVGFEDLLDLVAPLVPDTVTPSTSGAAFVEITGTGVHKGAALAALCADLGVDRSEVVAFGDQHNDLTMLDWAGLGVAMPHAHPVVLDQADRIAPTSKTPVADVLETLL